MSEKRGQVSIYIIFSITFLVIMGLVAYYSSSGKIEPIFSFGLDTSAIRDYMDYCSEETAIKAVEYVGNHGGYYDLEGVDSPESGLIDTAYFFHMDSKVMPSKTKIEEEISRYIKDNIFICLGGFTIFEEQGFSISEGELTSSVRLTENNLIVYLDYDLEVAQGTQKKKLKGFNTKVGNINLLKLVDIASDLVDEQMLDMNHICMGCIFRESVNNDVIIEVSSLNNDSVLFSILDNKTNQQLIYANKYVQYSCDDSDVDVDHLFYTECIDKKIKDMDYHLFVEDIQNMNATIDQQFHYRLNTSGLDLVFSDYTDLFDIDETTGEINFIPSIDQIGEYTIWIRIIDIFHNEDFKAFQLDIVDKP